MAWDTPTSGVDITSSAIMAGTSASDQVLVKPDQNTGARSSNAAFDNCYIGNAPPGCSADGVITAILWDNGTGDAAKPSWITWPPASDTDVNADNSSRDTKITITPPDGTVNGNHNIKVTWTPTYGSAYTYIALTFKVDCQVTSFTKPSAPVDGQNGFDLSYVIFETPLTIDVSTLAYV